MSEAHKGKKRRPFTAEHRRRISESRKGLRFSEEHKRKLSESHRGKHPTEEHRARLGQSMCRWWRKQPRTVRKSRMQKASETRWPKWTMQQELRFREKNPYDSQKNPREYSAWYHRHHPGYFARKTREWIQRLPKKQQLALYAKRNRKSRTYVRAYSKLRRRLLGLSKSLPSLTRAEKIEINNSLTLAEMFETLKARHPDWTL